MLFSTKEKGQSCLYTFNQYVSTLLLERGVWGFCLSLDKKSCSIWKTYVWCNCKPKTTPWSTQQIFCTIFQSSLVSFSQIIKYFPLHSPACFLFQTTLNYPPWSCCESKTLRHAACCLIFSTKASKNRGLVPAIFPEKHWPSADGYMLRIPC